MRTKHCITSHSLLVLICLPAIVFMVLTACNPELANSDLTVKPGNWVTLNIKFKPNTGEEQRDKSIKAIQRMLLHSVAPLMNQYKDYYPSMKVTTTPFTDTLQCWISIINTYGQGTSPMTYSTATGIDPPTCPQCPTTNPCRICDSLVSLNYAGDPAYGISNISVDSTSSVIRIK
jgi:hypothetical protein